MHNTYTNYNRKGQERYINEIYNKDGIPSRATNISSRRQTVLLNDAYLKQIF